MFLYIVIIGYIAGCFHKIIYNFDLVFWLYCINLSMVVIDLIITIYYLKNIKKEANICTQSIMKK